jgi:peptidoglycan pentaglycine glycine transferase (the first glycine)
MTLLTLAEWDQFLTSHPNAHLLQTGAWGELKSAFGWQPVRLAVGESGAQVIFRRLPLGFSLAYIPKGPIGDDWNLLWGELDALCRQRRAILLKIEPDSWEPMTEPYVSQLKGMNPNARAVQPHRTLVINLLGSENDWLAQMKQKCRYNIRLAEKKEISVHPTDDLQTFYALMQVTGGRDGFGVHHISYYQKAWELFASRQEAVILQADFQGKPLAGLMAFRHGKRAWYFYGASSDAERNRMPTYLLQFAAMRWAASLGCTEYDLWGVPDQDMETLESQFENRSDGLWGVYRFKRGFGGSLLRSAGAWEKIYNPALAALYHQYANRRGGDAG